MRRNRPCALMVAAAALALLLPQMALGQRAKDAAGDEETRAERVEGAPEEPTPDQLGVQLMHEMSKTAQEERAADREAAEAAHSNKVGKMREKKQQTQEQQEEERDAAWSNVGVQAVGATTAVGAAVGAAEPDEDED